MKRLAATAILSASLLAIVASTGPGTTRSDDFDRIGPADPAAPPWNGDRMRDARDRLKDMLPGRRT